MNAFILTAGFGTRLRPFTDHMPKTLVPVNGRPLILYTLAFLKHNGIRDVVMNLHHHGEKIPALLGNGAAIGMRIKYSREKKILGTGGGLRKALRRMAGNNILVVNGDVVADFSLKALIRQHQRSTDVMTMALYRHRQAERYGLIHYRGNKLTALVGEPPPAKRDRSAMYASYHVITKNLLKSRLSAPPAGEKFCVIRDVYIPELKLGKPFGAHVIRGFWRACDSLVDVKETESALRRPGFRLSYGRQLQRMASILLR